VLSQWHCTPCSSLEVSSGSDAKHCANKVASENSAYDMETIKKLPLGISIPPSISLNLLNFDQQYALE